MIKKKMIPIRCSQFPHFPGRPGHLTLGLSNGFGRAPCCCDTWRGAQTTKLHPRGCGPRASSLATSGTKNRGRWIRTSQALSQALRITQGIHETRYQDISSNAWRWKKRCRSKKRCHGLRKCPGKCTIFGMPSEAQRKCWITELKYSLQHGVHHQMYSDNWGFLRI